MVINIIIIIVVTIIITFIIFLTIRVTDPMLFLCWVGIKAPLQSYETFQQTEILKLFL